MPIHKVPLLEYWLSSLKQIDIKKVYINVHHKAEILSQYVGRPRFLNWVKVLYENELLGTAGTIRQNKVEFYNNPLLLIHSDNWSGIDLEEFINYNNDLEKKNCLFSMVTFKSENPKSCGIVVINEAQIVTQFQEKNEFPISDLANGAIYFLSPKLVNWICDTNHLNDFSLDVIPQCLGKILSWHNTSYHRDIGTLKELRQAQQDPKRSLFWSDNDKWLESFKSNKIHDELKEIK